MNGQDPLRNPKDPLRNRPDAERELFVALGKAASGGYSPEQVAGAAINLLVNAVRQQHATRSAAEVSFNELVGRARELLLSQHYDALGKRRNVFPFHQTIEVPLMDLSSKH